LHDDGSEKGLSKFNRQRIVSGNGLGVKKMANFNIKDLNKKTFGPKL